MANDGEQGPMDKLTDSEIINAAEVLINTHGDPMSITRLDLVELAATYLSLRRAIADLPAIPAWFIKWMGTQPAVKRAVRKDGSR